MRLLHLYRPRLPETRAQAIQVVHTAHALARVGYRVTLLADRAVGFDGTATDALAAYGLDHPDTLDLRLAPVRWLPGAGLWFRAAVAAWCADPAHGLVYARAKRYVRLVPALVPVVLEAHELDSALEADAGRPADGTRALEAEVLRRAVGLVTNCAGTLDAIRGAHPVPPHAVVWNATRADRLVRGAGGGGVGVVGSAREYKGVAHVLAAAADAGVPLTFVGAASPIAGARTLAAVPYGEVPALLAGFDAVLLPLADNRFGRTLTNPLKLWDYLATDRPIVAPDLPTIREVTDDVHRYDPAALDTVAPAIRRALAAGPRPPRLRTWDDRAADIAAFLGTLGLGP